MIITKKKMNRRTVLRGVGTALALPLLDSMIPALSAAPKSLNRFGAVYVPNGMMMQQWTPAADGKGFEFSPTLKSLEPFREHLLVLSGLNSTPPPGFADLPGNHGRASTRFLTDIQPKPTLASDLEAGISVDQIAAKEFGQHTPFASLELGLDSSDTPGGGDPGYSRAYTSTISWLSAKTPLPMENNPRTVFERLFGDSASTDRAARLRRLQQQQSILDAVNTKLANLNRRLGPADRARVEEYTEAIRDVERRMQNTEQQHRDLPRLDHPAGIPNTFAEHAKLMYDLCVVAYQSDLTRVFTFMISREFSGRTYPELGISEAHHPLSHHQNIPERLAALAKINTYHVSLFAYFVNKLQAIPDGDGSLLDHVTLIYGAGMSDGNAHLPYNLPVLLIGGGGGIKGGEHIRYPKGTPLANLHVTILDKLGILIGKIGDSTGEFNNVG
jgi:Protein of unknown function (DUF1552)